jgi:hypothetical protein
MSASNQPENAIAPSEQPVTPWSVQRQGGVYKWGPWPGFPEPKPRIEFPTGEGGTTLSAPEQGAAPAPSDKVVTEQRRDGRIATYHARDGGYVVNDPNGQRVVRPEDCKASVWVGTGILAALPEAEYRQVRRAVKKNAPPEAPPSIGELAGTNTGIALDPKLTALLNHTGPSTAEARTLAFRLARELTFRLGREGHTPQGEWARFSFRRKMWKDEAENYVHLFTALDDKAPAVEGDEKFTDFAVDLSKLE